MSKHILEYPALNLCFMIDNNAQKALISISNRSLKHPKISFIKLLPICLSTLKYVNPQLQSWLSSSSSFRKGLHSRLATNRTGAEGLSFYYPRLLYRTELDAGSGVIKPASSFVIQNRQTSYSMWCPMYRARC